MKYQYLLSLGWVFLYLYGFVLAGMLINQSQYVGALVLATITAIAPNFWLDYCLLNNKDANGV